jgi:predicted acyltransferase
VILFLLGLVINGFPRFPLHTLRIYGVLQRIAICYLAASILYLFTRRVAVLAGVTLAALFGYWVLMRWVGVPGLGVPTHQIPLLDPNSNWVAYLDRKIFPGRLYEGVRDPEGLLSSIPSLATALLGVLTGLWLSASASLQKKATWLLVAALCGLALGKFWALWFPINKKLWTSSYVLFAAGATLLVLAICFFLVEVRQWKRAWTFPWIVFGSNAIVAYIFSELLAATLFTLHVERAGQTANLQSLIYEKVFSSIVNPSFGSLLYSLAYVAVCFVPVAILYRKRMFIKI